MTLTPPLPDPETARAALTETFSRQQETRPHRFMTEFDIDQIAPFVAQLMAQRDAVLAVRGTKASVIMPTRNRGHIMLNAVRSVLNQSHRNLELIIVDDGSTDGTQDMLSEVTDDTRLRVIAGNNGGVSGARNCGLDAATGDVISYLDTDNVWTPDYLRLMMVALEVSGADCAYAAALLRQTDGSVHGYRGEPFNWDHCLTANYVDLNVFCHKRSLYEAEGGFDPVLRRMVDWDLVLRFGRKHRPVYCPFFGCVYSDNPDDNSRVSTSQPYLYHEVVALKNAQGHASAAETIAALNFRVALKMGASLTPQAKALADALADLGHDVRLDTPDSWNTRHVHQDDVVIVLEEAEAFVPHPEQITFAVGLSGEDFHATYPVPKTAARRLAAQMTADVRQGMTTGVYGKSQS
ncbi:glycosyltransferase family 2 protein [Sulfitobacter aestuariivivens]